MRIAFLGLGHMGAPMVRQLLEQGHTVAVYNRTPGRATALIALGAIEAQSVAEAIKGVEVAITMLPDDAAVKEMVHGPAGLLQNLPAKAIHLCMSTIGVELSTDLASAHAQAGQGYVAGPVFGRPDTARTRHLWIVAGGPEPQVNRCRPIFDALGRGYTRVGSHAPLAHAVKLGGNMLSMAMDMAVSELLIYAKKAGLPPQDYLRFLNTAVFRSHMGDDYGGTRARPSFDPEEHTLDLAASELILQQARNMGVEIPVADLLQARLQAASARGWGEQDLAELSQTCRLETGVEGAVAPEPKAPTPPPIKPRPGSRTQPEAKLDATPGTDPPLALYRPLPQPSQSALEPQTGPSSFKPVSLGKAANPPPVHPTHPNPAGGGGPVSTLDLENTSHFELIEDQVWAWSKGQRHLTPWHTFGEVETAFNHVLFLLIQRRLLLRPEAVQDLRPKFGGGAKVLVAGNIELDVSRAAAPRLKVMLGI